MLVECEVASASLPTDSEIKLVFSILPARLTPNIAPSWDVAPPGPLPWVHYDPKAGQRSLDVMRGMTSPLHRATKHVGVN
jgi:hypothetical protein